MPVAANHVFSSKGLLSASAPRVAVCLKILLAALINLPEEGQVFGVFGFTLANSHCED